MNERLPESRSIHPFGPLLEPYSEGFRSYQSLDEVEPCFFPRHPQHTLEPIQNQRFSLFPVCQSQCLLASSPFGRISNTNYTRNMMNDGSTHRNNIFLACKYAIPRAMPIATSRRRRFVVTTECVRKNSVLVLVLVLHRSSLAASVSTNSSRMMKKLPSLSD